MKKKDRGNKQLQSDSPSRGGQPAKTDMEQGHEKIKTLEVLEKGTGKRSRPWLDNQP